ncbi:MAG: hypothetical protein H6Q24_694 [Bacteroidetes bacterium]|jgi:hypothetical protein|nr:hypothetical protein [Bacteroidota bacterium]
MAGILIFSFWLALHPVHVSLLSIDYAPDKELFNVFLRIYFDDFLLDSGIKTEDQKKLDFSENNSFTKEVIGNYVNDKIRIIVNKRQISAELENIDLSDNELRMNLFLRTISKVNTITIKNLVMTSLYNDQANMIIVRVNDFEQGVKLTAEETEKTFEIN